MATKRGTKKTAEQPASPGQREYGPVNVTLPNFSHLKMQAVSDLSRAIERISRVLTDTDVHVTVSNCHITASEGSGAAVRIGKLDN